MTVKSYFYWLKRCVSYVVRQQISFKTNLHYVNSTWKPISSKWAKQLQIFAKTLSTIWWKWTGIDSIERSNLDTVDLDKDSADIIYSSLVVMAPFRPPFRVIIPLFCNHFNSSSIRLNVWYTTEVWEMKIKCPKEIIAIDIIPKNSSSYYYVMWNTTFRAKTLAIHIFFELQMYFYVRTKPNYWIIFENVWKPSDDWFHMAASELKLSRCCLTILLQVALINMS